MPKLPLKHGEMVSTLAPYGLAIFEHDFVACEMKDSLGQERSW
jgi:hypothetical protein